MGRTEKEAAGDDALSLRTPLKFSGVHLVCIAPYPALPRLDGTNERVAGFMEVFGGMLVLGRIATAHVTTAQAQAQVDPCVANLHALFAHMLVGGLNFDLIQMIAALGHKP